MKLTKEFLSKYPDFPQEMTEIGMFTFYRTYSRTKDNGELETWKETCHRAVEYSCSLAPTSVEETEHLFDNMFHLRQFLSGRTLWVGGTDVAKRFPMSNFNCSNILMDKLDNIAELFYLLMIGTGVGVRILKEDVEKLPPFNTELKVVHEYYDNKPSVEHSNLEIEDKFAIITVGDSKEGWVKALEFFIDVHTHPFYRNLKGVTINYDHVRPKGSELKTFGGTASGHESLKNMFTKLSKVFKRHFENKYSKLRAIDVMDIATIIAENVVVGGVRRSAELILIDKDDVESVNAKSELFTKEESGWVSNKDLLHRTMSNNAIAYQTKPSFQEISDHVDKIRYSGEPGFLNGETARKRFPSFKGVNPCAEILLDDKGLCNLTTVNVMSFVEGTQLNIERLLQAQRLSVRASLRMTLPTLELSEWDYVQKKHRLLGCSLTGWQDMVNALKLGYKDQVLILQRLRDEANKTAEHYAHSLGVNVPTLITTVKPEGTLSLLPTVSSGVHYSHSPYYVRRIRINAHDPLVAEMEKQGWTFKPEVGQDMETATTLVVEFPVKAPKGITKYDVSAIEQLEIYKLFMEHYVQHNTSITVHVRESEWEGVKQWIYDNWDSIVAISFLSLDDNFYELAPYEAITQEQYIAKLLHIPTFKKIEGSIKIGENTDSSCDTGICPIR